MVPYQTQYIRQIIHQYYLKISSMMCCMILGPTSDLSSRAEIILRKRKYLKMSSLNLFLDFYIKKCKLKSFSSPKRLCVKCGGLVVPHVDCILHDPAHCQHNKGLAVAGKIGLCFLLCILRGQGKAGLSGLGAMQPTEQPK